MSKVKECVTKHNQLCWDCEKACGGCSWSKDFIPVKGWDAVPTKVRNGTTSKKGEHIVSVIDSFEVRECPEFEPLKMADEMEFLKLLQRNIGRIGRDRNDR